MKPWSVIEIYRNGSHAHERFFTEKAANIWYDSGYHNTSLARALVRPDGSIEDWKYFPPVPVPDAIEQYRNNALGTIKALSLDEILEWMP